MSFDFTALECLLAVSDTGSFTRAADRVARTQSAVSQKVAKLEAYLGSPMFVRDKELRLTSDGELLVSYARQLLKLRQEVLDAFRRPELAGDLKFGLPEDFASVFLSDVLTEYTALHPRVMLNVSCDLTLNLFDRFKNREFDLVLVKMNKPENFPNGIEVWSEALEWVGNKSVFEQDDEPIPLVLSPKPCVYREQAIKALETANRRWRIVFASESYAGKVAAVRAGIGMTVLPRNMVPEGLDIIHHAAGVPPLEETHVSLLKHSESNSVVNSMEDFVLNKLR